MPTFPRIVTLVSVVATVVLGGWGGKATLDQLNATMWAPTYNYTTHDDQGNYYEDSSARLPHENGQLGKRTPAEGYPGLEWENVSIVSPLDNIKTHAWFLKAPHPLQNASSILYFHNNGGNIGMHLPNTVQRSKDLNANIMLVEYRGYGYSQGKSTEKGITLDAQAALEALLHRQDINKSKVFIHGSCLGGAVALAVAQKQQNALAGLILENTYTNAPDGFFTILSSHHKWFNQAIISRIARLFIRVFSYYKWENDKIVPQLHLPILFVSGTNDFFRPQMQKLFRTAQKGMWLSIEGGNHFSMWQEDDGNYAKHMSEFMKQNTRGLQSSAKRRYLRL